MTTTLNPRHAEILAPLVTGEYDVLEAGNRGLDGTAPHPTLAAMARRGLVTLSTRRQGMIGTSPVPYVVAKVTQAGIDAYNAEYPPSAEEELGECVGDEPGAMIGHALHAAVEAFADRLPEPERAGQATVDALDEGFGHGYAPTDHPTPDAIVARLVDAGMNAGVDPVQGPVVYTTCPRGLDGALGGTGWAAAPLLLAGITVPGMYVVERAYALPPVPTPRACGRCGTVRGSGCASCRPDSVLGG